MPQKIGIVVAEGWAGAEGDALADSAPNTNNDTLVQQRASSQEDLEALDCQGSNNAIRIMTQPAPSHPRRPGGSQAARAFKKESQVQANKLEQFR